MATRFCSHCGSQLDDTTKFCTNCGAPVSAADTQPQQHNYEPQPDPKPQYIGPKPKNYLALSILATIFCCLPFGIPAIVFAAKVDSYWNAGNYQQSMDASRKARNWMLVSVILGALAIISYFSLIFLGVATMGEDFLDELRNY